MEVLSNSKADIHRGVATAKVGLLLINIKTSFLFV